MSFTWLGRMFSQSCQHNRQHTNRVKNNNLPLERENRSFAEMSTQNFEQMQWCCLEGLSSGWRWRLGRTVLAPCPPEFSCTDQGWRVNSEDVSPTHQSNITPVEPRGKAKSVSTFFSSWLYVGTFHAMTMKTRRTSQPHIWHLTQKKWKTKR